MIRQRAFLLSTVMALCGGCSCRGPEVAPVATFIRVDPLQVDFGRIVLGGSEARVITVTNSSRASVEGAWAIQGEGFRSGDGFPARAEVGDTPFTVFCSPDHAGVFDGQVIITFAGFAPITIPLACEVVPAPSCVPSGPCRSSQWDVSLNRCAEMNIADGTTCQVNDVCLSNASCHAGRCEGSSRDCNDGDPCTADTCDPSTGCQHPGPIACPSAGPCRVGQCVSGIGCTLVDTADGTPCGQRRSCTEADVCITGQCVLRDPPDGFSCSAAGPCGGEGRCVNDACESTATTIVTPTWTQGVPDGGLADLWSDLLADRTGALHLSSYFMSRPRLNANRVMPLDVGASARRCIVWHGWLVCGDLPGLSVSAVDLVTGATAWTYSNIVAEIAEFNGPRVEVFSARLAVLNENELLAIYESRTITDAGTDPRCRVFAMVVLDRAGQPLRSRFINDPIFSTCNHQHSYGVAVDAQSNIYLGFAASNADNPATAMPGTTIFSYSPALQLRWRIHDATLQGGELAVGDGVLLHEWSEQVFSTSNGTPLATLSDRFGFGVIGEHTLVAARLQTNSLEALRLPPMQQGWRSTLSQPTNARGPLTVATWSSPWGPREVVLAFTSDGTQVRLEAVELATGASAFRCDVALPDIPIGTAMTPGGLAVMNGVTPFAQSCDTCDPRYARTQNAFGWLPLPGLTPSNVEWSGMWGNEAHSHHEGR